ncbi:NAD-dependent epimerase/dehydratase family protein [Pseudoxanthomonas sp. PXM03]|uniref:NAD-dependent epimerase/dehydratase family protein n=1 Tax=Pseudoxanthomonas sp. PXM03 TaxID=2769284 RepID=UPI0017836896|nr:NAD-dependent epimerase/dehydratase family protein [Pseudoxanthomonas sp. PXM03]MBD9435079.1 NAD-dependent epimerase/dehydratase family protein [Pseudoxanthomonas sp. PXM03]
MIVGRGLLARSFAERYANKDHLLIFASGVSNSAESDPSEFGRERRALEAELAKGYRRSVYFGSCGVADRVGNDTPYMNHKRAMESIVQSTRGGLVLRLPQVVGRTDNPNTLTNFLRDRILSGESFQVWSRAERNLIDIDDVVAIASAMIECEEQIPAVVNIAAERSVPMPAIVAIFEEALGRKANFDLKDQGTPFPIESAYANRVGRELGIDLGSNYAERVIRKYYGQE